MLLFNIHLFIKRGHKNKNLIFKHSTDYFDLYSIVEPINCKIHIFMHTYLYIMYQNYNSY